MPILSLEVIQDDFYELVTLDQMKTFLRVTNSADDDLIVKLLRAAVSYAESVTMKAVMRKKISLHAITTVSEPDVFLRWPPVISIDEVRIGGIAYEQYRAQGNVLKGLPFGQEAEIVYTVGYQDADRAPADIRMAVIIHAARMYEGRGGDVSVPSFSQDVYNRYCTEYRI